MLSEKIIYYLNKIAEEYISILIPLPQTTSLIIKNAKKLDRIDSKLIKEAEKLNRKEFTGDVKQEHKERQRIGAITYRSYTIEFKKELITSIRQQLQNTGEGLSKIIRTRAKETGIHPKNITRWYHTKELKKKEGGRRALYPEMEIRLANFILNNPKMKRKHILRQAKQIMEDLKIPGRNEFNFSKGWYERFRERLSKKKVAKGTKLEDNVKIEAKEQNEAKEELEADSVKKQEEGFLNDEESFDFYEDSFESEDNIKFQQNLSDSLDRNSSCFNVKLSDHSDESQDHDKSLKQSLFFESQSSENSKISPNNSTDEILRIQAQRISPLVRKEIT